MDLSQFTDEELQKIAGEQPVSQAIQPQRFDMQSFSDEELQSIAGVQPQQAQKLEPTSLNIAKTIGSGIINYAQKLGTGVNQLANELGIEGFAKLAKLSAKIQRPDLAKEIDSYSSKEITDLLSEETKRQTQEREVKARESGLGFSFGAGEVLGGMGAFGGIGGKGAVGVGVSTGTEALFKPTEKEEGLKERGIKGAKGFATGYIAGKVVDLASDAYSTIKKGLKSQVASKNWDDMGKTTIKLKEKASNVYNKMNELKANISEQASSNIANNLDDALKKSGKINKKVHEKTLSVLSDFRKELKKGKIGLEDLDQYRQLLNKVSVDEIDIAGNMSSDGQKAIVLIEKLDDLVDNLKPKDLLNKGKEAVDLLKLARSDWKTFKKYQKIVNVVEKAGADPNRIKSAFQRFVSNKRNLIGFTDLEKQALKRVAQNTSGEKILKTLGKFGIDLGTSLTPGNTFLPVASVFAGTLSGAPGKGVGFAVSGTIARQAQKQLAKGKVVEALSIIESGGFKDIANVVRMAPTDRAQRQLLAKILSFSVSGKNINKKEEE